jgi:hypothetical protein
MLTSCQLVALPLDLWLPLFSPLYNIQAESSWIQTTTRKKKKKNTQCIRVGSIQSHAHYMCLKGQNIPLGVCQGLATPQLKYGFFFSPSK